MTGYNEDFGPFGNNVWLNCAHQGPIPKVALERAHEAVEWKRTPFELTTERFSGTPARLKSAIARLIHAKEENIVLGNSASYGLHLLANGLPLNAGDEVLLTEGDFPSVLYPWVGLEKNGILVRFIVPKQDILTPEELDRAIGPQTRVFCATWVHSFSGRAIDMDAMGDVCRKHNVLFIANTSQAIGTRPLNVSASPVDAIVNVGHKWLCGPYGTGFCWMQDSVLQSLTYNQAYWLSMQTADDLGSASKELSRPSGPRTGKTYDVFGTANFFNYLPWTASIEYLLSKGVHDIAKHNQSLIDHFIEGMNPDRFRLLSPGEGPDRSTLTLFSFTDPTYNEQLYLRLKRLNIHLAYRRGNLRMSPHLYNTKADIDQLLDALNSWSPTSDT